MADDDYDDDRYWERDWERESPGNDNLEDRSYHESFYRPYPYSYYYGERPSAYSQFSVPPPFPPPRPLCESANTIYAPANFYPGPQSESNATSSYEIEVSHLPLLSIN